MAVDRLRCRLLLPAVALVLLASGCASRKDMGAPQQKPSGPAAYSPQPQPLPQPAGNVGGETVGPQTPSSLEEAAQQLDQSEQELSALFSTDDDPLAPPPSPGPTSVQPQVKPSQPSPLAQGDRCSLACRALGSMDRSASRICELAGAEDERCQSARERVGKARARVERACSACSS